MFNLVRLAIRLHPPKSKPAFSPPSPILSSPTYLLPAPHIDSASDGACQIQTLGPRAVFLAGDDFDFAELLAEAHDGVGGFCEGELLSWVAMVSGRVLKV